MVYTIGLKRSDGGYAVWVPALPGCCSQGDTEEEAIENIKDAIQEYLAAIESDMAGEETRKIEVAV